MAQGWYEGEVGWTTLSLCPFKGRDGEGHSRGQSFIPSLPHPLPNFSFTASFVHVLIQLHTYPSVLSFTQYSPNTYYALGHSLGLQVVALHPSRELCTTSATLRSVFLKSVLAVPQDHATAPNSQRGTGQTGLWTRLPLYPSLHHPGH